MAPTLQENLVPVILPAPSGENVVGRFPISSVYLDLGR
jgi:hypothetical protein